MNTYKAIFQPYARFECLALRMVRFEAPNDKLALLKAGPFYGWGCCQMEDNPDPEELQNHLNVSLEEMVETYKESNGDGCSFLFLLQNETTGEVIFEEDCVESDTVEKWNPEWIPEGVQS